MTTGAGEADLLRAEKEDDRRATAAELGSLNGVVNLHRLRWGGMLRRALTAEVEAGVASPEVRRAATEIEAVFDGWLAEARAGGDAPPLPLAQVVGVQYGAILAAHAQLERP